MPIKKQIENLVSQYLESNQDIVSVKKGNQVEKLDQSAQEISTYRGRPLFFKYVGSGRGRGPYVELQDGSVKLDLINGIGIHVLGHAHPEVVQASVSGSLTDVVMQGNLQPNKEYLGISKKLVDLASRKSKIRHAWLSPSGTMANENALKMCRQKTDGARMIIAFEHAFAGRTTMMAEVTDNDAYRQGLPRYQDVLRVPYYDAKNPKSIEETKEVFQKHLQEHKGNICCFMFEPMQGEGGYRVAPREFFVPLLEMCKKEGIPVFLDEVQTFCRTGEFFAFETLDLGEYVDVVSVAKTLQNGATLYSEDLNPKPGLVSGTFSGSSSALSAGAKVLEVLESGYMGPQGRVMEIHHKFVNLLKELSEGSCQGLISEVEGMGLMVAFTPLQGTRENMIQFVKKLFENGVMCFGCGANPYRARFLLPAVLEDQHFTELKQIIEKTLLELK